MSRASGDLPQGQSGHLNTALRAEEQGTEVVALAPPQVLSDRSHDEVQPLDRRLAEL
jgi:hypothetical protein